MKKLVFLCVIVVLIASMAYAGGFAQAKKPVVGLVLKGLGNEFQKTVMAGAIKRAEEDGTYELIAKGVGTETDIAGQVTIVEQMIASKVDVIVIAPIDSSALIPSIKKAVESNIIVVNYDDEFNREELIRQGIGEIPFVGPDNVEGAELAGDYLAEQIGGAGHKVIILEGIPGVVNADRRTEGFMNSVKKYKLDLLVSRTAHFDAEEANVVLTNLLTMYPDVEGVMCANDNMGLGAVKAIEVAGLQDQVKLVGFDNTPAFQELMRQGKAIATIEQHPELLGSWGVDTGLKMLRTGEKITGWIKVPVELVTMDDLPSE